MSESFVISPYVWRHICPNIYDVNVQVSVNKYTIIELPKELRIQGAGNSDSFIQSVFKTQGGFRAIHLNTSNPANGVLDYWSTGWIYTPRSGVTVGGTDSFKYTLKINSEMSSEALINIKFQ